MKRYSIFWVAAVLCGVLTCVAVWSAPSWWNDRGVLLPGETNDYSVINLGQLKNMAYHACEELDASLPQGGAGASVSNLVNSFSNDNNYAVANLGQLKTVAQPFYDRLIEVGYTTNYPWSLTTGDDSDFSAANIGQLKNVFSFDAALDSDSDGMPDWWELLHGLNPYSDLDADMDTDGDGLTDYEEIIIYGSNPDDSCTAGDGLSDGWKVQYGFDPTVAVPTECKPTYW